MTNGRWPCDAGAGHGLAKQPKRPLAFELSKSERQSIRFGIYQSAGTHALDKLRLVTNTAKIITACLCGLFPIHVAGNTHAQRVALVIGNADYQAAPLKNPVNDARAMATRLAQLGFGVTKLENATRKQMGAAIEQFERALGPEKVGLFYYAGHGMQVRDKNYLVPVDANLEAESSARYHAVDVNGITEAMEYAGSKVNFIILDACRDNPFKAAKRGGSRGLAPVDAARGTLIAYATAPGSVAADGIGRNGLYTSALLAALDEPGLSAEEVFKQVRVRTAGASGGRQTPWESSSLTGNFVFNAPTVVNVQAAPKAATTQQAPDHEALFWTSVKDSQNPKMYEEYLRVYPNGNFAGLARIQLESLRNRVASATTPKIQNIQGRLRGPNGTYASRYGRIAFECDRGGACEGRYTGSGDREPAYIIGTINAENLLVGHWIETHSSERCNTRQQGSHYWGRIQFRFDEDADTWDGNWSYCKANPSDSWDGARE